MTVSRPAVSQHLKILKQAGLVNDAQQGTRRIYQLNPEGIFLLRAHFEQIWERALSNSQPSPNPPKENMQQRTEKAAV